MALRFHGYFLNQVLPKRPYLSEALVIEVIRGAEVRRLQSDGRWRIWARRPELGDRWLRVVLLEDGETVLNAFIDRDGPP